MEKRYLLICPLLVGLLALSHFGCESSGDAGASDSDADTDSDTDIDSDSDMDTDSDTDTDGDTDTDVDTDTDADTDTDTDGDTASDYTDQDSDGWIEGIDCDDSNPDANQGEEEVWDPPNGVDEDCDGLTDEEPTEIDTDTTPTDFIPDCSGCPAVGTTLEHMRCAADICDDDVYQSATYTSPSGSTTAGTYEAVAHFGDVSNDLDPLLFDSYALVATGPATGTSHSQDMGGGIVADPYSDDDDTYDVMEWSLNLKAPEGAHGVKIHYVFFSEEYDDFIDTSYNDKFYIVLEAGSTNSGQATVINYTDCRNPSAYFDFDAANGCDLPSGYCCYIAINTSFSECCWYGGCPDGYWTTDIAGTGYTCANSSGQDSSSTGSSTGWLYTEWVIDPNEEFTITFHIHDTFDGIYDSEVIIDKVIFVTEAEPGTGVV